MDQKIPVARDPFHYHPNLRGLITDPLASFFRDFNGKEFVAKTPQLGNLENFLVSDELREATRGQILNAHGGGDLWVFAYGSLMWDPAFCFAEVRRAHLADYARQFILKDVFGARGNSEQPGLMAALDHGLGCDGLLFRIEDRLVEPETSILWHREMVGPAYKPTFVEALIEGEPQCALTFVADHAAESIQTNLTRAEQVEYIATGTGFLGTSLEYLTNIAARLESLGIHDPEISALVTEVEQFRASRQRDREGS